MIKLIQTASVVLYCLQLIAGATLVHSHVHGNQWHSAAAWRACSRISDHDICTLDPYFVQHCHFFLLGWDLGTLPVNSPDIDSRAPEIPRIDSAGQLAATFFQLDFSDVSYLDAPKVMDSPVLHFVHDVSSLPKCESTHHLMASSVQATRSILRF